ncbi:Peptidyl-prolyl cis-trans isomerase FKBP19, chloroplastic [Galdieria sulphuraria]|uniref:peptidylprolyl isomerase n=1 Tax=Galdieria sulphuraria TaxID=130081 RepID=M2Y884_GALSU|nr:immunophilin [Galdieria sulphuraria]EME32278.1 immunophilin [Galdieria sulphuraria]GJD09712.1 Peptidyl-prolyl cis-trans isomerase FKBP19, chloroplastic [Galdieria sulphuraria]|eukprot:XP_005708798.1 immunophilin [Galdieria sulphuraria]
MEFITVFSPRSVAPFHTNLSLIKSYRNKNCLQLLKKVCTKQSHALVSCKSCLRQSRRTFLRSILRISTLSYLLQLLRLRNCQKHISIDEASAAVRQLQFDKEKHQTIRTPSGLQYFDIKCGEGPLPKANDLLVVRYTSRLQGLNGWKLESSEDHEIDGFSEPLSILYNEDTKKLFVPGFWEALSTMRPGGKRRAIVPPNIAYHSIDEEPRPISWDARRRLLSVLNTNRDKTIVFDIELQKILPYCRRDKKTESCQN